MIQVQQVPGTHQLLSRLENVCRPLLPYPMIVRMHKNPPYFLGLWPHLNLAVLTQFILSSSLFPSRLFPSSCLPTQCWMVTRLHLSRRGVIYNELAFLPRYLSENEINSQSYVETYYRGTYSMYFWIFPGGTKMYNTPSFENNVMAKGTNVIYLKMCTFDNLPYFCNDVLKNWMFIIKFAMIYKHKTII